MNKHYSIPQLFTAFSVLLLALTCTPFCFAQAKAADKPAAQAPAQRQLLSIQFLRIKIGMGAEWREFRKNETLPMLQKAGVKQSSLWITASFGEGGYLVVTPIESLSQYDNPGPATRALGQEGAMAYNAKGARFVESSHAIAIETRPDLSLPPKADYQAKLIVVTTTTIAPGRNEEYENLVKTVTLPTMKKAAPKGYMLSQVAYGGTTHQYISAVLLDSFADLQRYREAFAKEMAASKLGAKFAGIVTNRENAIYRFVPELSIVPTPAK